MDKRVALCFSGHIRDFSLCYNSQLDNFILPLQQAGYQVDTFAVFWDVVGHRSASWLGNPDFDFFKSKMSPKSLIIKEFEREKFVTKYATDQWKTRQHLSCYTSSGDSVSMWYGVSLCFQELETYQTANKFVYDVVCRVRPDLLFTTPLDMSEINDIVNIKGNEERETTKIVYMPKWRGKYYEVCKEIVDYFAMGSYDAMKVVFSTFENIPRYIRSTDVIHTGEGFLLAQLTETQTRIKRTSINFHLQRKGYIENMMC